MIHVRFNGCKYVLHKLTKFVAAKLTRHTFLHNHILGDGSF